MKQVLSILDPVLNYINDGKLFRQPFQVFYYLIGIACGLGCIYYIKYVFDMISYMKGIAYLYAVLVSLVLLATAALSVIYWFRKAADVNREVPENARFMAIPAVAGFIITLGEWAGLVGAAITFCVGILTAIILPMAVDYKAGEMFSVGLAIAIVGPIVSYVTLIVYRFIGEMILAVGNIANDTRKIAENQ